MKKNLIVICCLLLLSGCTDNPHFIRNWYGVHLHADGSMNITYGVDVKYGQVAYLKILPRCGASDFTQQEHEYWNDTQYTKIYLHDGKNYFYTTLKQYQFCEDTQKTPGFSLVFIDLYNSKHAYIETLDVKLDTKTEVFKLN